MKKAINNQLNVDTPFFKSGAGLLWNNYLYQTYQDNFNFYDPSDGYLIWEKLPINATSTWMYNYEGKIYMEISPYFDGDFENKKEYNLFIENYNMIFRSEVNINLVNEWKEFCMKFVKDKD